MSVVHVKSGEVETWQQKFMRKFKEEPFVPIGTALTCFALFMASRKLGKKGESKSLNRWFRARIIFQGATIGAIVVGSYTIKNKEKNAAQDAPSAEELKLKERLEFEERLRKAEENHEIEQAMRGGTPKQREKGIWARLGLGRGPAGSVQPTQSPDLSAPSAPPPPIPTSQAPSVTQPVDFTQPVESAGRHKKPSRSWFGWGSSSGSDSEQK